MNRALNAIYRFQKLLWRVFRPHTQGVKVMLFNENSDIILIRNSYGQSDQFVLPGGGIRPWEDPATAARREISEELGLEVHDLTLVSKFSSAAEGKRDTIHLFEAQISGDPTTDRFEVEEAAVFSLDDLPAAISPATRRRIDEYRELRPADGGW